MYKGYTIQPYSPKAGTGLSSHEVNQPGYRDVTDTTVVAQFKAINETLPAAFTRLWRYPYLGLDNDSLDVTFKYCFD
jgi:isoleucyl-tRNA synthetase